MAIAIAGPFGLELQTTDKNGTDNAQIMNLATSLICELKEAMVVHVYRLCFMAVDVMVHVYVRTYQ